MSLPIQRSRDPILTTVQTTWSKELNPILAIPILQGLALTQVALINGITTINHLLNRQMTGWFLTDISAAAMIYRSQPFNPTTLVLTSNAACVINLWVY